MNRLPFHFPCLFLALLLGAATVQAEPLTLNACVATVLSKHPSMVAAQAGQEEKHALLWSARKDLLPSLAADYTYKRQQEEVAALSHMPENYYNYGVTVSQPVFRGGALYNSMRIGELDLERARAATGQTRNDLVLATHRAYFSLLKQQKLAEESRQAVARLEKHLADARNYYEAGLIPKNDLLTSELELAQGRQNLVRAENQARLAATSLNILMRQPADQDATVADEFTYTPKPADWGALLDQALKARPELQQAELSTRRAAREVKLAEAEYYPSIDVSATYEKQGDKPGADSYPYGANEVKSAQAVATWKFWAWGQSLDRVAAAQRRQIKAKEAANQTQDEVTLQLREAFLNLEETRQNIGVTEKAIAQAEENYRINESRYQAQVASSTDLLDAQTLLVKAKSNYWNAVYDYNIASAAVDWASGTLGGSDANPGE
ncbi:MAG: TolC family protein [Thermodesulfobacteriota bacterium]